jgi:hypothetical protein
MAMESLHGNRASKQLMAMEPSNGDRPSEQRIVREPSLGDINSNQWILILVLTSDRACGVAVKH